MKITVIGGGYVGRAIARSWYQAGHHVTVTTTTPEKIKQLTSVASQVAIAIGEDLNSIQEVIRDRDLILLCVSAKKRTIEAYRQAYLATAQNVLQTLQANPSVKQLIYTSSYGILGDKNGAWTDETSTVNPTSETSEILAQTEEALLSVPKARWKTCILRLSGIYGPGRELIKIFRSWAGTTRPGSGEDYRNWIHLDDIVGAIKLAQEKQLAGIYHVTSDEVLTSQEFFRRLFQTHNLPPIQWDNSQSSSRPYNLKLSNQKLKAAGFKLIHPQIVF
ncbi:MAG: SDR family oxidoreductase [Pleurocapsa sp.]